ncbi:hypothetical protein D9M73_175850 [compost metagenome]
MVELARVKVDTESNCTDHIIFVNDIDLNCSQRTEDIIMNRKFTRSVIMINAPMVIPPSDCPMNT